MPESTKDKIKSSLSSFIAVIFIFGGGWLYLDQKRQEANQVYQEAMKLKIEADLKIQFYEKQLTSLEKNEKHLKSKSLELSRDSELSALTLKFINEFAGIDSHIHCGDNPKHNAEARKAKALLALIESKAKEYGRFDIVNTFVNSQKSGIYEWSEKCKL